MGKRERDKGGRGEREWRWWQILNMGCLKAHRGRQDHKRTVNSDVEEGIPGLHPEVKRVERLNIHTALKQALEDGDELGLVPYVAFRRNREGWKIAFQAEFMVPFAVRVVQQAVRAGLLSWNEMIRDQETDKVRPGGDTR
jgi:hypothetical protein